MRALASLFALLLAVVGSAQSDLESLQDDYRAMSTAFQRNDPKTFDALLAPGYTLVQTDGTQWSRDRVMKDFRQQMGMMRNAEWDRRILRIRPDGSLRVVDVIGSFNGSFKGRDGAAHVFEMHSYSRDTWQVGTTSNRLVKSQIVSIHAKVDGKSADR